MSAKQFHSRLPDNQQISKCFDVVVRSQIKWETFVLPTIESVAILSGLVYQASKIQDIKLDKGSQNPQSLHSWLTKVCNKTENVFREKVNHLRTIQYCGEVIVENLTKMGEGSVQKKDFPQLLNKIEEEADQCQKSAESVVNGLSDLTDLVSELLNMCEASQTSSQEEVNEIRKTLKENEGSYELVKVEKENLYKRWEQISQKREKISTELANIDSSAFIDELCVEAVKQLIPKIIDLMANPGVLTMELLEGLKFLVNLGAKLISKDPEQSTEISEIVQKVKERAAEKIQKVQDELEKSNRDYDKKLEEMKSLSKEGEILLRKIKDNQTEQSKLSTSLELMTKGLLALGSIKTNWSNVINVIQMIPLITGECGKVFESFDAVGDGDRQGASGITVSNQYQVSQAIDILNVIGDVLETYVKSYEKHLEVPLRDMVGQGSSEYKFNQIQKKCNAARKVLHDKATENQKSFEKSSAEAIEQLRALESRK